MGDEPALHKCQVLPRLLPRPHDGHKGQFGRVLVVACSPGMTGAGCMAAVAAQRAGAGLVTLALPRDLNPVAEVKLTSAMSRPLPQDGTEAVIGPRAAARVLEWASDSDVVALGPGIGRAERTVEAVRRLVARLPVPVVLDADGLNALVGQGGALADAPAPRTLTPHPGEMARLTGATATDVQADRPGIAVRFARRHHVVLALKGAGTVVTDGDRVYVNPTGNPGMATGGTGDVLTGLVAGLACQGLDSFGAAQLATFVHGLAGDLAAADVGELSLVAEDVLDRVPEAFGLAASAREGETADDLAARLGGT